MSSTIKTGAQTATPDRIRPLALTRAASGLPRLLFNPTGKFAPPGPPAVEGSLGAGRREG